MNIKDHFVNGVLVRREIISGFNLGDVIASVATPMARVLKLPCIDPKTGKLKPDSGCQKRINRLNKLTNSPNT